MIKSTTTIPHITPLVKYILTSSFDFLPQNTINVSTDLFTIPLRGSILRGLKYVPEYSTVVSGGNLPPY